MGKQITPIASALLTLATWLAPAPAQEPSHVENLPELPAQYGDFPQRAKDVRAMDAAHRMKFQGQRQVLVLPGVVADRRTGRVELIAEATGLPPDQIIEFLLVAARSDKGYEALFWSHALPSDVHRALEFVGAVPGKPFAPDQLRFWPLGPRIAVYVTAADENTPPQGWTRVEQLVKDAETGCSLPEIGFVFAGSYSIASTSAVESPGYAADVSGPGAVISVYNEPTTVLDTPQRSRKELAYGSRIVSPKYRFAKHDLVKLILQPEQLRHLPIELTLCVRPGEQHLAQTAAVDVAALRFALNGPRGEALTERPQLPEVLNTISGLIRDGRVPYVSIRFDNALKLSEVRQVCRVIAAIDCETGIRVLPPPAGQLFYEAMLPDPQLLDPGKRIIDPWELHLSAGQTDNRKTAAWLERRFTVFPDDDLPEIRIQTLPVETPASVRKELDADADRRSKAGQRPGPPILMVFASGDMAYGSLMQFVGPVLPTHNIIHVFLNSE